MRNAETMLRIQPLCGWGLKFWAISWGEMILLLEVNHYESVGEDLTASTY